jgi:hypothetical protein
MDKMADAAGQETHPLFPSGAWEGFYTYAKGAAADEHKMQFLLTFKDNGVDGSGGDDVGSFSWQGSYNIGQMECALTKYYSTHSVYYKGQVDENGIWGLWEMGWMTGGFHIWPKKDLKNQEAQELEIKVQANVQESLGYEKKEEPV